MNKLNRISILLTVAVFFLTSCHRELDVAPVMTFDGHATHTIAQLLEYHPIANGGFTYDTLPQGIVIEGTVISSDEQGNCYKYINIDDGTAGIQIKINSSVLYPNYPLGQHVFVKCDGLVLGDYGKLPQLGWWENDGMEGISTNKLYKYVFKDGLPGPKPEPTIELTSANQIQENMYNRLVRLKNVHFTSPGVVYAGTSSSGTENEIAFEDGTKITLYTSMYAKFASQLTPAGNFDMVAILTRFATASRYTNQLVIRSLDDMGTPVVPPTITEVTVYGIDLNHNPLENGWNSQTITGSSWGYISGAMKIAGTGGDNNSWLISPAIATTGYSNLKLMFTNRSLGSTANRQVYYSTDYTEGDVQNATWIPLDGVPYTTSYANYSKMLPDELLNSDNLRFAFCYQDNTSSTWLITDFKVVSIVEQ
ncbi:MAG: OB-fold nucleic acid binding domain-containing protein [Bacteroidales bacterium]|nr:OB-fold nucleic acid binding domain-containing protein [Bacteroidales bacterium]